MPDYPALEAYNRECDDPLFPETEDPAPYVRQDTADAMRDEYEARIKALEAELAAERGKRCDWLSEDCTDAATYIPEIDAVRFSQGVRDDCSTVYIGKEEADAILALLTAEQGATDE